MALPRFQATCVGATSIRQFVHYQRAFITFLAEWTSGDVRGQVCTFVPKISANTATNRSRFTPSDKLDPSVIAVTIAARAAMDNASASPKTARNAGTLKYLDLPIAHFAGHFSKTSRKLIRNRPFSHQIFSRALRLIGRELLLRKKVREIVVCAPPSMLLQWKDELESPLRPDLRDPRQGLRDPRAQPARLRREPLEHAHPVPGLPPAADRRGVCRPRCATGWATSAAVRC